MSTRIHLIGIGAAFLLAVPARAADADAAVPAAAAAAVGDAGVAAAKDEAYQLYDRKQFEAAAARFKTYLEQNPDDLPAALDFAALLSQLKRHEEAARVLEAVWRRNPNHETAAFRLGVEYVELKRPAEAEPIFAGLERSANAGMSAAAAEARRRLQDDQARETRFAAEGAVFQLAAQFKHEEVLAAIGALERQGPLSFALAMQRLYALQSLGRFAPALDLADRLAAEYPAAPDLALVRADLLAQTGHRLEAVTLWRKVERDNAATAEAARAAARLQDIEKLEAEDHVFELARQDRHRDVIEAVAALEQKGPLSAAVERQRIHAWQALGLGDRALTRARELAEAHPEDADLALQRADLLEQNGQWEEAGALLKEIQRQHPGTPAADEAARRLEDVGRGSATRRAEQRVFELAARRDQRGVVGAVDDLEKGGDLSWNMQMQRLYALQALGETDRGLDLAARLAQSHPDATDLALVRADLLVRAQRWREAAAVLNEVKDAHAGDPAAREADRRLKALPAVADEDRWYWGEAYLSGDYLGRFGTVIGSGFIRHGTFIPGARWLQPFQEFSFLADTRSRVGGRRSVIADNFVGLSLGLRAQPFAAEYFYVYASGGLNKDLLDVRENGDWTWDYQAGAYGFKSWGPGTVLHTFAPEEEARPTTGQVPPLSSKVELEEGPGPSGPWLWRLAWFADVGADFSYYKRHIDWLGYGQAHEGCRLFQVGPRLGFDLYAVQNLSWDTRGNYFDNLVECGPGLRWLWAPRRGVEVVLRGEWLKGYYLGRDDRGTRNGAEGQYDDFRVGLSLGLRW